MKHIRNLTIEKASAGIALNDLFYRLLNSVDSLFYNLKYGPLSSASFFNVFSLPLVWIYPDDSGNNTGGGTTTN